MSPTLVMILQLLAGLSIIVIIHELGHFLAARWFGMKVEKFYLFYDIGGFALFRKKVGDVEYGVGWLPLGGYVKIAGMIDESLDTDSMGRPPQPWEFRAKPAWQRLLVMSGGVIMNFILGVLLLGLLTFSQGEARTPTAQLPQGIWPDSIGVEAGLQPGDVPVAVNGHPVRYLEELFKSTYWLNDDTVTLTVVRGGETLDVAVTDGPLSEIRHGALKNFITPQLAFSVQEVVPETPAAEAGLRPGDSILAVNGQPVRSFQDFKARIREYAGKEVTLTVWRDGKTLDMPVRVRDDGTLGFMARIHPPPVEHIHYGLAESFVRGLQRGGEILIGTVQGLGKIFTGQIDASRSIQGPISIARKIYGGHWDWIRFWTITALLSLVIGLMNILPIPALDGGHIALLFVEMVRGRPLSTRAQVIIQNIGMILLGALFIWIIFNDIIQNFWR